MNVKMTYCTNLSSVLSEVHRQVKDPLAVPAQTKRCEEFQKKILTFLYGTRGLMGADIAIDFRIKYGRIDELKQFPFSQV